MNIGQEKPRSGERPRPPGRRGLPQRLKHSSLGTWVADRWWRLDNWLYNWWHPPSSGARRNRLSRAWRHLEQRIRGSWLSSLLGALFFRLHDWWYPPPSKEAYSSYDYYALSRRSRLELAWRRLQRRITHSALRRRCEEIRERLYQWWFPVSDDSHPYPGHYGRSRPVVAWRKFERWARNSWLGKRSRKSLDRFYEWW
jgi:hypothetical protein